MTERDLLGIAPSSSSRKTELPRSPLGPKVGHGRSKPSPTTLDEESQERAVAASVLRGIVACQAAWRGALDRSQAMFLLTHQDSLTPEMRRQLADLPAWKLRRVLRSVIHCQTKFRASLRRLREARSKGEKGPTMVVQPQPQPQPPPQVVIASNPGASSSVVKPSDNKVRPQPLLPVSISNSTLASSTSTSVPTTLITPPSTTAQSLKKHLLGGIQPLTRPPSNGLLSTDPSPNFPSAANSARSSPPTVRTVSRSSSESQGGSSSSSSSELTTSARQQKRVLSASRQSSQSSLPPVPGAEGGGGTTGSQVEACMQVFADRDASAWERFQAAASLTAIMRSQRRNVKDVVLHSSALPDLLNLVLQPEDTDAWNSMFAVVFHVATQYTVSIQSRKAGAWASANCPCHMNEKDCLALAAVSGTLAKLLALTMPSFVAPGKRALSVPTIASLSHREMKVEDGEEGTNYDLGLPRPSLAMSEDLRGEDDTFGKKALMRIVKSVVIALHHARECPWTLASIRSHLSPPGSVAAFLESQLPRSSTRALWTEVEVILNTHQRRRTTSLSRLSSTASSSNATNPEAPRPGSGTGTSRSGEPTRIPSLPRTSIAQEPSGGGPTLSTIGSPSVSMAIQKPTTNTATNATLRANGEDHPSSSSSASSLASGAGSHPIGSGAARAKPSSISRTELLLQRRSSGSGSGSSGDERLGKGNGGSDVAGPSSSSSRPVQRAKSPTPQPSAVASSSSASSSATLSVHPIPQVVVSHPDSQTATTSAITTLDLPAPAPNHPQFPFQAPPPPPQQQQFTPSQQRAPFRGLAFQPMALAIAPVSQNNPGRPTSPLPPSITRRSNSVFTVPTAPLEWFAPPSAAQGPIATAPFIPHFPHSMSAQQLPSPGGGQIFNTYQFPTGISTNGSIKSTSGVQVPRLVFPPPVATFVTSPYSFSNSQPRKI